MKRLSALLAFSTVLAYGSLARAADLPEAPADYDWTGFYIGGNIGYAFGGNDKVGVDEELGGAHTFFGKPGDLHLKGIYGGPEIGYNIQAGQVVFGAEGDFEFSGINDSDSGSASQDDRVLDAHSKDHIDWFSTIRGRLGYAFDNLLLYGTGGLAIGQINYKVNGTFDDGSNFQIHDNYTKLGWTAGAGLEWGFDEHWSAKAEYKYVNFGRKDSSAYLHAPDGDVTAFTETTDPTPEFHSIEVGINYRF